MTTQANIQFSKERLLALPLPEAGKRATYHDTKTQGLQLRVSASGVKAFCMYRRIKAGQPERITLGRFPTMTVEQARKSAAAINAEIEAGASPAAAKRAVRGEMTFAETLERYLAEKKKRNGSPLTDKTKRNYLDIARLYLAPITGKKLTQITRAEVKAIHAKVSKKSHAQADRAAIIISSVFNFATDVELFSAVNPATRIQKNPTVSRDRFAQPDELPYLFAAIAESSLGDYFLLSLLTGARRSNMQEMAWRDIDLQAGVWKLKTTKNGTPQNVTLSPEAVAALQARKRLTDKSPFVFPGTGKTGHLVEPKTSWVTLLRRASVRRMLDQIAAHGALSDADRETADALLVRTPALAGAKFEPLADALGIEKIAYDMTDIRIHDLRRTLGSWQAKTGASLLIIGKSLNHKTPQATAIYARLDLDPVRQSVNTATQAMYEAAGLIERDANGANISSDALHAGANMVSIKCA